MGRLRQRRRDLEGLDKRRTGPSYKPRPIFSMEERVASVEGCRYVDEVGSNAPLAIDRAWIEQHSIDLILDQGRRSRLAIRGCGIQFTRCC